MRNFYNPAAPDTAYAAVDFEALSASAEEVLRAVARNGSLERMLQRMENAEVIRLEDMRP